MDEFRIGRHILQPSRQLLMDGERVHIGPRALDILTVLAEANGEIVTKDELFEAVWPGQVIEENALQAQITTVRKALGDDAEQLETIRGVGYQLHGVARGETVAHSAPETIQHIEPESAPHSSQETPPQAAPAQAPTQSSSGRRTRLFVGIAAAVLLLGGGAYVATKGIPGTSEAVSSETVTAAIVPFSVIGDLGEDDEQLGSGLAGALNTSLSQLSDLALVSNSGPAQLAEEGLTLPEMAQRLGIEYFIEGEIRFEGDNAVLWLALTEAETTRQIWREQFRGRRKALPLIASNATDELVRVMQVQLGVGAGNIADSSGVDPEAYEAYLRGMQHFLAGINVRDRTLAFEELRQSVRLDPDFAPSQAALGMTMTNGVTGYVDTPEGDAIARNAIERALQLDPQNLLARVAEFTFIGTRESDTSTAIAGFEQIVEEHPDYAPAQAQLAHDLMMVGEYREALEHSRAAKRIDPLRRGYSLLYSLNLSGLGAYNAIRSEALDCIDCLFAVGSWLSAVIWLADDAEFAADFEQVIQRAAELGLPEDLLERTKLTIPAMRHGRGNPFPVSEYRPSDDNAMLLGEFGQFEAALQLLENLPGRSLASGNFMAFMDTPRKEWPEAVRADPRYHQVFDIPNLQGAIAERRKRGHTKHLPVFPVKPYEGP